MSDANRSPATACGPLADETETMRALYGRFALRVPMWMVVQDSGETAVTFIGASRDPALRLGSTMTHQMILGAHVAIESNQFQGHGLSGFLRSPVELEEWAARGQVLCDPAGYFAKARIPR
jgi:hypothetical protein